MAAYGSLMGVSDGAVDGQSAHKIEMSELARFGSFSVPPLFNLESSPPPVLRAAEGDVPALRVEALDNVLKLGREQQCPLSATKADLYAPQSAIPPPGPGSG